MILITDSVYVSAHRMFLLPVPWIPCFAGGNRGECLQSNDGGKVVNLNHTWTNKECHWKFRDVLVIEMETHVFVASWIPDVCWFTSVGEQMKQGTIDWSWGSHWIRRWHRNNPWVFLKLLCSKTSKPFLVLEFHPLFLLLGFRHWKWRLYAQTWSLEDHPSGW